MDTIPHYLVEAVANHEGLHVAVSRWLAAEVDTRNIDNSNVPFMLGNFDVGVEAEDQPECYTQFTPFTALVKGELALCRMLHKVLRELAELSPADELEWADRIMMGLNELMASTET